MPRQLESGRLEFTTLSDPEAGPRLLRSMLEEMERYDRDVWAPKVESLREPAEQADAEGARRAFQAEIEAFRHGVELLRRRP